MATITLEYSARSMKAKKALDFLFSMGFTEVQPSSKKKTGLKRTSENAGKGCTKKVVDSK